ncbi:hypothetical protein GN244_ATG12197 [Phytophthora infestans]|uniref:Uncharacterized protein n=1 Tax=Phytophthora infestans TaxID=4787 RepID=A0A833SQF9_PHYIN|nr:hypothetical protein GN244_ATG12197 [Phytophthora infestans]
MHQRGRVCGASAEHGGSAPPETFATFVDS